MRYALTNHVLRMSVCVYALQRHVRGSHAWCSVVDVWMLVCARLWVAVMSLPFMLALVRVRCRPQGKRYVLRRRMTTEVAGVVTMYWVAKIALAFLAIHVLPPEEEIHGGVAPYDSLSAPQAARILFAHEDPSLSPPQETSFLQTPTEGIWIRGTSEGAYVAVYIISAAGSGADAHIHIVPVADDHTFALQEDADLFQLTAQTYRVEMFSYDASFAKKSTSSSPLTVVVTRTPVEWLLHYGDVLLNVAMAAAVVLGVLYAFFLT